MADSVYSIDIAAAVSGGDATADSLDRISAGLLSAGRRSDDYQESVRRLSADLEAARAVSAAANAELGKSADQYQVLEREAIRAGKALEKSQGKGVFDANAARSAAQANAALAAYQVQLGGVEAKAASAAAAQSKLEKELRGIEKTGKTVDDRNALLNQRFEKLGQAVNLLPGPMQGLARGALNAAKANQGLTSVFGSEAAASIAVAAGIAAVAVAVLAATAAAIAGYVAFAQYATVTADTARSAELSREALAALSDETSAAVGAFDAVTEATGLGDAQLAGLTKQLRSAGVAASDMPKALRAAATAEAALGAGGAGEFIDRVKAGTLAVGAFARETDSKFGGIVAQRLLGLDAQTARFKRLWSGLFDGVNLDPVLAGFQILVDMFDKANPLAQFLSATFEGLFGPVANNAVAAAQAVEAFALGVAIQLTKAYIVAKPFLEAFGADFLNDSQSFEVAGRFVANVLVGVAGAFALAGAAVYAMLDPIGAAQTAVEVFGPAIAAAAESFVAAAYDLGSQLIAGMVRGITDGATALVSAVSATATTAIDAAKSVLGIESPSRVFAEIGGYTAAGFAAGIEGGTAEAQGSMVAMVSPTAAASSATPAAVGAGKAATAAGGARVDLSGATFNISGVTDAEQVGERVADAILRILEGDAASLAGAPA